MFMQEYEIHLINGSVIPVMEPMELEGSKSLIDRFANGDPDEVFCVGDYASGYAVVPARSIVYISTGDVHEIEDWVYKTSEMLGCSSLNDMKRMRKRMGGRV